MRAVTMRVRAFTTVNTDEPPEKVLKLVSVSAFSSRRFQPMRSATTSCVSPSNLPLTASTS